MAKIDKPIDTAKKLKLLYPDPDVDTIVLIHIQSVYVITPDKKEVKVPEIGYWKSVSGLLPGHIIIQIKAREGNPKKVRFHQGRAFTIEPEAKFAQWRKQQRERQMEHSESA